MDCSQLVARREAAYIISNIIKNCQTIKEIAVIARSSWIVGSLFRILRGFNASIGFSNHLGICVLESIECLLALGAELNQFKYLYQAIKCEGIETLESMQNTSESRTKDVFSAQLDA